MKGTLYSDVVLKCPCLRTSLTWSVCFPGRKISKLINYFLLLLSGHIFVPSLAIMIEQFFQSIGRGSKKDMAINLPFSFAPFITHSLLFNYVFEQLGDF